MVLSLPAFVDSAAGVNFFGAGQRPSSELLASNRIDPVLRKRLPNLGGILAQLKMPRPSSRRIFAARPGGWAAKNYPTNNLALPPASTKTHLVPSTFQPPDPQKFAAALRGFDEENSRDPNCETAGGVSTPRELLYAQRLTDWVLRIDPEASETLRLAARCQHLCRWEIPRENYPPTRAGYLQWRADLKKFHAQKSGAILRKLGYDDETIRRVQDLNLKKHFPADAESRVLEDALCLVFLEFQFAALAAKSHDDKMINALKKSWGKMSAAARTEALKLNYGDREKALLQRALNG